MHPVPLHDNFCIRHLENHFSIVSGTNRPSYCNIYTSSTYPPQTQPSTPFRGGLLIDLYRMNRIVNRFIRLSLGMLRNGQPWIIVINDQSRQRSVRACDRLCISISCRRGCDHFHLRDKLLVFFNFLDSPTLVFDVISLAF